MKKLIFAEYATLLKQVKVTLIEGQARIEAERVATYWKTGHLIQTHILKHQDRGEYGAEVTRRLANDLHVDLRILQRCIQFAKFYPRMPNVVAPPHFTWTHYTKLLTVTDEKKRTFFEKAALKNNWSSDELALRIQDETSRDHHSEPRDTSHKIRDTLLTPLRGELYTYQLVERPTLGEAESSLPAAGRGLLVDLGFGTFHNVDARLLAQFSKGDIVESRPPAGRARPKDDAYKFYKAGRTPKDLYTYAAYVEKVIDADTIKVRLDLGFNVWSRQILRLRDLNAPEMDTKEGQEAKAFIQSHVKESSLIIVRSSRSDKYDRYLADVFVPKSSTGFLEKTGNVPRAASQRVGISTIAEPNRETDIYLNNLLLEKGYAERWE